MCAFFPSAVAYCIFPDEISLFARPLGLVLVAFQIYGIMLFVLWRTLLRPFFRHVLCANCRRRAAGTDGYRLMDTNAS